VELATRLFDLKLADGVMPMSLENLIAIMRKVAGQREARCALVIDFASRLTRQPDHLDANEHRFFVAAERISLAAHPIVPKGADIATANGKAHFNPILWLVNRGQDLPSWLALDSTRVAVLSLGLPDYETRLEAARHLGNLFAGFDAGTVEAWARAIVLQSARLVMSRHSRRRPRPLQRRLRQSHTRMRGSLTSIFPLTRRLAATRF